MAGEGELTTRIAFFEGVFRGMWSIFKILARVLLSSKISVHLNRTTVGFEQNDSIFPVETCQDRDGHIIYD